MKDLDFVQMNAEMLWHLYAKIIPIDATTVIKSAEHMRGIAHF
jgi:hypothetical protein